MAPPLSSWPRTHWLAYGAVQKGVFARSDMAATDRLRFIVGGCYGSHDFSLVTAGNLVDHILLSPSVVGDKDCDNFTAYASGDAYLTLD